NGAILPTTNTDGVFQQPAKGDELDANGKGHKLPNEILHRDNLMKWADNKLRGELTFRSIQLKELELDRASK
ncbi:phage/plasmid replication domain-containing protein, partial [Candidatus Nitrotoga sp. HW29]|uniref:phage/plasmid replication domain-containing protein n=1 Tax=Candidatus Nitrotoga sp. HW29 TaxID=2886963 RepID=UPI001EF28D6C